MTSEIDVTNSLNKNHSNAFFSKKGAKLGAQTDQPLEFSTSHSTILIGIEENIFDYVPSSMSLCMFFDDNFHKIKIFPQKNWYLY